MPLDEPRDAVAIVAAGHGDTLQLPLVAAGRWLVCAGGDETAPACAVVSGSEEAELRLDLVDGTAVHGRCVNPDGAPAKATIGVFVPDLPAAQPSFIPLGREGDRLNFRVTTDEDGRFTIDRLAPGRWALEVTAAGGRMVQTPLFDLAPLKRAGGGGRPGRHEELTLPDIVLPGGLEMLVSVTDTGGVPLEGVEVGAVEGTPLAGAVFYRGRTDAHGRLMLAGFSGGKRVVVTAEAKGFGRAEQQFAAPPAAIAMTLDRLAAVAGRVVTAHHDVVADAHVELLGTQLRTRTDAAGAFRLADVPPGQGRIALWRPRLGAREVGVLVAAGEELDLGEVVLDPPSLAHGVVRDAETMRPIPHASVDPAGWPPFPPVTADRHGRFTLEVPREGPLPVRIHKEGYAPRLVTLSAPRDLDSNTEAEIQLARAGWLAVQVWEESTGGPCAGCRITVTGQDLPKALRLTTGPQGGAVSGELAPGKYLLYAETVRATGSVIVVSSGNEVRRATVRPGVVTAVELGTRRVPLRIRVDPPVAAQWRLRCTGKSTDVLVSLGPQGSYLLRLVPGERYRLALHDGGATEVAVRDLEAPDSEGELSLRLPRGSTVGVLTREGVPAQNQEVTLIGSNGAQLATSVTDQVGSFILPFVPPGAYLVVSQGKVVTGVMVPTSGQVSVGTIKLP